MAEYYIPKIEGKDKVNHKDGNKANNKIENLEWVTPSENSLHSRRVLHPSSTKAVRCIGKDGEVIGEYRSIQEASEATGTNSRCISNACLGKLKSSNGYLWENCVGSEVK